MSQSTMRAIVIHQPGGSEVLKLTNDYPIPKPKPGWVLIQVKAFGLNRSEMFTRQGHSPGVQFPRVLGIEATGVVAEDSGDFKKGETVATAMGGMGRAFDGGYAEYTLVPATQALKLNTSLPWDVIGALPEMMQTAWGSLNIALQLKSDDRLLIRGGTTGIGLAAAALAKSQGVFVVSTTRKADRASFLKEHGADDVLVDNGTVGAEAKTKFGGFTKVLELIGVSTMKDSFKALNQHGILCITGIAGGTWSLNNWNPMEEIPVASCLTVYGGGTEEFMITPLNDIAKAWEDGKIKLPIKTFKMEEIAQAHEFMEHTGGAKVVVLT